ncbi:alpha/beta hydrolase [Occultella glacieicola]|uniref:Alpha/beta hydrolase n=1 Tax=Occultella glacieicola TaxID=2518684 RepID=A0ABY2E011_9MICO|nr:alpha/beta hydrolase [Occultella glacieicola]TDE89938.1 alpha/beta hydrolase [Occultella glacieicola]
MSYRTHDVAVRGGTMHVAEWGDPQGPPVLAVHGITASHRSWGLVAQRLPQVRLIAPDLRGRGRSRDLPGPFGMPAHADDLATVLAALDVPSAVVLGHSMGAFASVVLSRRHAERVRELILVDGGVPVELPVGLDPEEVGPALLGPAATRLAMTFPTREAYREFWRVHPAFADWNDVIEDYVDYDLIGTAPDLHPSTTVEAVTEDSLELAGGEALLDALAHLSHRAAWLRAPRGLLNEEPGLYSPAYASANADRLGLDLADVPGTNHYTITLGPTGADAVADVVRRALTAAEATA